MMMCLALAPRLRTEAKARRKTLFSLTYPRFDAERFGERRPSTAHDDGPALMARPFDLELGIATNTVRPPLASAINARDQHEHFISMSYRSGKQHRDPPEAHQYDKRHDDDSTGPQKLKRLALRANGVTNCQRHGDRDRKQNNTGQYGRNPTCRIKLQLEKRNGQSADCISKIRGSHLRLPASRRPQD
jgi:hypothetical protein